MYAFRETTASQLFVFFFFFYLALCQLFFFSLPLRFLIIFFNISVFPTIIKHYTSEEYLKFIYDICFSIRYFHHLLNFIVQCFLSILSVKWIPSLASGGQTLKICYKLRQVTNLSRLNREKKKK